MFVLQVWRLTLHPYTFSYASNFKRSRPAFLSRPRLLTASKFIHSPAV
jgi:hypothetical protein